MTDTLTLANVVSVAQRYRRSTKIDTDFQADDSYKGFIPQGTTLSALDTMARFVNETEQRAFTWTGPYGSGKSSLALFLSKALAGTDEERATARRILLNASKDATYFLDTFDKGTPYALLTLIGHNASLAEDFKSALGIATSSTDREAIDALIAKAELEPAGFLLIFDELGKYLEGGNSDNCYFLQELAESLNRCHANILLIGVLHQAFDAYATALSKLEQDEWAKVQGRYVDIPLLAGPDEILELISHSLVHEQDYQAPNVEPIVTVLLNEMAKKRSIDEGRLTSALTLCAPINPVVAILIGPLSRRRFLQNTRSVFNFLTSREPFGFSSFLENTANQDKALYTVDLLWDYLRANFEQSILASSVDSSRWLLASSCVERVEKFGSVADVRVAKAIAILDLFKRGTGIETTRAVISAALYPTAKTAIDKSLKLLVANKVIIERKFLNAYTLFEGSDFNLDAALEEARQQFESIDTALITNLLNFKPLIARRHYTETGTMRWFQREVVSLSELDKYLQTQSKPVEGATGRIVLCLPDESSDFYVIADEIGNKIAEAKDQIICIGIPTYSSRLVEFAKELQALTIVLKSPELEGDAIARREVLVREEMVRTALGDSMTASFNHAHWYSNSGSSASVRSQLELTQWLSHLCDDVFSHAPVIQNELINRDRISTNVSRARSVLMRRMIDNRHEERLGITEFPPEAMLYLSILKAGNMHRLNNSQPRQYDFSTTNYSTYNRFWEGTEQFFTEHDKPTLQDLYDFWGRPPYGVKAGIKPILALVYYLANDKKTSVYLNGAFQAEFTSEVLDFWIVDPKSISLRFTGNGDRNQALLDALQHKLAKDSPTDLTPLEMSRIIVAGVLRCPKWAMKTSQLSEQTRAFREVVIRAWDPLELLFKDLPDVFDNGDPETIAQGVLKALEEIENVTPMMLNRINDYLLKAIDAEGEDLSKLRDRATAIKGLSGQMQLDAFIARLSAYKGLPLEIEGIISLAVNKPKISWTDRDIDLAMTRIAEWALQFRHLEGVASLRNRKTGRRMFGLVMAGEKGSLGKTVDLPAQPSKDVAEAADKITKLLKSMPQAKALAALVEAGLVVLGDR